MSRLEIDYAAAPISDAAKIRFRYKLEGFDEDWVDAGTRRQAFYTNLPPRSYKFMVSASSRGGIANASRATWEFSVAPTLYQTNLFYISGAASVALVLGTAWWLRLRAVRAEYDAVLAERMRVGREIHDTLLQSVAATALQIEGLVGQLEPGNDSVKLQLRALRKQIEENLREVRHFIRHLRWPTAEDVDVARVLHEFLDRLAVERGFRPHFNASGQQSKRCSPRVRNELLRIGQEAITNAVRHARPKNIDVNLSFADECVHLRVSDDGCGFDAENLATAGHWGMIGMRERATSCGGRFGLRSSPGAGTEVDISLPLR
jgi:signal transduction histidine kinase